MKKILYHILTIGLLALSGFHARAGTTVTAGTISIINGVSGVDLTGEVVYAVNFNDITRTVKGVNFVSDTTPPPGVTLVGPQNVVNWQTKPEFSDSADDNSLEEIYSDIRWANAGAGQKLEAHMTVTAGENYKLQILIGANWQETRRWDIQVEGVTSVDEITSLGKTDVDGNIPPFAANERVVFTQWIKAGDNTLDIVMGNLDGANDGGDRNAIWQAIILQKMPSETLSAKLDLLAYWPFNDASNATSSTDTFRGRVGELLVGGNGTASVYTADAGGRTGQPGDRGMDFGTAGGNGTGMRVALGEFLNIAAGQNQIAFAFWQKLHAVTANTAFKGISPGSSGSQRGASGHSTWSDNNFYWDTAGCCDGGTQRISQNKGAVNLVGEWHHIVFQKKGDTKEIWVDGTRLTSGTNTAPLPTDFTTLEVGHNEGPENVAGIFDDFAVFADALSPEQIAALAGGTKPNNLVLDTTPVIGIPTITGQTVNITITDIASGVIDITKPSSLQIENVTVTTTISKVGPVTTISHVSPTAFVPGALINIKIAATTTTNIPVNGSRIIRAPYISNIRGGADFNTEMVWTEGNPQLSDAAGSEAVLNDPSLLDADHKFKGKTKYIHFDDNVGAPILNALSTPYPLFTDRGDRNDFAIRSKGQIFIRKSGKCWFNCNSDDGFSLRIDGTQIGSAGNRGRGNTFMSVNLTAGVHDLEFVHWERGGGAGVSVYVFQGVSDTQPPFDETSFELIQAFSDTTDTDGDGMPNWFEELAGLSTTTNDANLDKDSDGLTNIKEFQAGTLAEVADTDGDGLNDGAEIAATTNPKNRDTDNDGLTDGQEVNTTLTNPKAGDTDSDGFNDGTEVAQGTDPKNASSFPFLTSIVGSFTGGDPGEGLDMTGTFLHAFNIGTPGAAPGKVGDVQFNADTDAGITVNAQNEIGAWNNPNYGDTQNDDNLEFVMQSIRWSAAPNVPTIDLDGLTKGKVYKLQLLFAEQCCSRGFDVEVEGVLRADEFNPGVVMGGINNPRAGAVVTVTFVATDTQLNIVLNGNGTTTPAFTDHNAIVSGVTLETLNPPDTDNDGLADAWEQQFYGNLNQTAAGDQDADGSPNSAEFANNTSPKVADTDGDGLKDGAEITAGTNPLNPDTDGDTLSDSVEVLTTTTDPTKADTDGDTWDDASELNWPTNAKLATSFPALDPAKLDLLAYWNFNDNSAPALAKDSQHQFVANFLGATAYSADAAGRTGVAGDRALNMGANGGSNGAVVRSVRWFGLGIPADENQPDQVAISFWQRVTATPDASSFWVTSPSSNNGQRGFQAHVPWSNGEVYFDTAGCCDANSQRVNGAGGIVPNVWQHWVFQKNGGTKEVWKNGALLLTSEGATRLTSDFVSLYMGAGVNSIAIRGLIDDFAVFGEFLNAQQIASLAGGASPPSLIAPVAPPVLVVSDVQYNAVTKLFTMTWNSVSGKTYKVEYSQTMVATSWLTAAASVPAVGASTSYTANLNTLFPGGVPAKFYMRAKEN